MDGARVRRAREAGAAGGVRLLSDRRWWRRGEGGGLGGPGSDKNATRSAPMGVRWGILLLGLGMLHACTVLPAGGKAMDVFQAEEGECRAYAQHQPGGAPAPAASTRLLQAQYDRASVQ